MTDWPINRDSNHYTHPEGRSKHESVSNAVDNAKRNYGEEIDIDALIDGLESEGWTYHG